jgi:hypothetical protein
MQFLFHKNIHVEDVDNLYLNEAQIKIGNIIWWEDLLEYTSSTNIQCKFTEVPKLGVVR